MAQTWLDNSNFENRRLEDSRVSKIANDIKKDKWIFDGTPIRFNGKDNIPDGQHRLFAIVKAGKSVQSLVIRGLETSSKNTIDTGKSRSIGDILHFNGHVNTNVLAGATRLAIAYKEHKGDLTGWSKSNFRGSITNQEIIKEAEDNANIVKAVQAVVSLRYTKKLVGGSVPSFCYYLFMNATSQHIADHFFQQLENGHDLGTDSPILLLRNTLALRDSKHQISGVRRATYNAALFIKAWNAWRKKEPIKFLKYGRDEEFPKVSK